MSDDRWPRIIGCTLLSTCFKIDSATIPSCYPVSTRRRLKVGQDLPHSRNLTPPTTTKFSTCWYLCRMRNAFTLTLAIFAFILSIKHVSAISAVLTARQSLDCGTIICPNLDWLWNNASPAAAGFGTWLLNQFQSDDPLAIPTDEPDKNRKTPPSTQPDVELWVVGDQPDVNDCSAVDFSAADNPRGDEVTHSRPHSFDILCEFLTLLAREIQIIIPV